jgi:hypothetical protein
MPVEIVADETLSGDRTAQKSKGGVMGSLSFRKVLCCGIAAIVAPFAFSSIASADIGIGLYKAIGGADLQRNVCWRIQVYNELTSRYIDIGSDIKTSSQMVETAMRTTQYVFTGSADGNVILQRDKTDRKLVGRYIAIPCPPPPAPPPPPRDLTLLTIHGGIVGSGIIENLSTTTIKSPTDKQKIKQDPIQAIIFGRADLGRWFATAQVTFAGSPHGNFTDTFPAASTSANVTGGQVYGFIGDVGYTVWSANGWTVGVFGGYYTFNEELSGTFPGFPGTFALLNDHWQAGEGGVNIDKVFSIGSLPLDLNVTVAGQYDNLRSGAFNGNGGGVRVNGLLSFPLTSSLNGNIHVQYANLNASGSNTGVPLTFNDEVWTVGAGISYRFGASSNPVAPIAVKAPLSR